MDELFVIEHCDYAYVCITDLIEALINNGLMDRVHAFSYVHRLIKGSELFPPLKVYRKPFNCLPFDEFQPVEPLDLRFILDELRDCAYRDAVSCSIIDYVSRKALIKRLDAVNVDHQKLFPPISQTQTRATNERVSSASKIAISALMERCGLPVATNMTKAADMLTAIAHEQGYSVMFSKDTIARWYQGAQGRKGKVA